MFSHLFFKHKSFYGTTLNTDIKGDTRPKLFPVETVSLPQ